MDPNRSVSEVIHEVSHQPLSPNRVSRQNSFTPHPYSDNTSSEVYVFCMWIRIVSQGVSSVHSVFIVMNKTEVSVQYESMKRELLKRKVLVSLFIMNR